MLDSRAGAQPEPARTDPPQIEPDASAIELDPRGRLFSLTRHRRRIVEAAAARLERAARRGRASTAHRSPAARRARCPAVVRRRTRGMERASIRTTARRSASKPRRGAACRCSSSITAPWDAEGPDAQSAVRGGRRLRRLLSRCWPSASWPSVALLAWRNLRAAPRRPAGGLAHRHGDISARRDRGAPHGGSRAGRSVMRSGSSSRPSRTALLVAALFCLLYIAVEPYVRRRWPDRLISWTRLVSGDGAIR